MCEGVRACVCVMCVCVCVCEAAGRQLLTVPLSLPFCTWRRPKPKQGITSPKHDGPGYLVFDSGKLGLCPQPSVRISTFGLGFVRELDMGGLDQAKPPFLLSFFFASMHGEEKLNRCLTMMLLLFGTAHCAVLASSIEILQTKHRSRGMLRHMAEHCQFVINRTMGRKKKLLMSQKHAKFKDVTRIVKQSPHAQFFCKA